MLKKIISIVIIVIGIAVIILGASLKDSVSTKSFSHSASYYDADGASFGGDFYTYIYGATDTIVDELDDINKGISVLADAQSYQIKKAAETTDAIYKTASMIVIAIGAAIAASGLGLFAAAFTPVKPIVVPVYHAAQDTPTV